MQTRPEPAGELAGIFASLSGMLLTQPTVDTALAKITSLAMDTVAGSIGSGISLFNFAGERITSAATQPLVSQLDDLQYQLDDGPCLAAWRDQVSVRSDDLAHEARWSAWCSAATALGIKSMLSAPMTTADRAVGAMKVYSTVVGAYSDRDEDLLHRFADQAAIFVSNLQTAQAAAHLSDLLKETLLARDLISTARGIIMVELGLDADGAYRHLINRSSREGETMHQLAERIVTTPRDADRGH